MKLLAVSTAASGWAHHAAYLPGVDPRLRIAAVALAAGLTAVVDSREHSRLPP